MKKIEYPPLLLKYLKMYQEDPKSKVFALLSECYRKIGLYDEALSICLEGLVYNPDFIGGRVALARVYFDLKNYEKTKDILKDVIEKAPDNLMAQRLYGDACLRLGFWHEAVQAYKMYLYYNPYDQELFKILSEIETKLFEQSEIAKKIRRPEKARKLLKLQELLNKIQRAQSL
jgi:tetratricopeptide (TPR) repeat protein